MAAAGCRIDNTGRVPLQMYGRLRVAAAAALLLVAVGLPAFILMAAARPAAANGASTLLYEGMQGRYRLVVRIIPARPVVPQTHFSMQVFDAAIDADADADADAGARPLRDTEAQVTVAASGPPGAAAVPPLPALNDASLAYFEVDVPFDAVGRWQLRVTIASDDAGGEVFAIPLDVEEARAGIQWIWIGIALAAIVLAGLWTWFKVSRGGRDADAAEAEAES